MATHLVTGGAGFIGSSIAEALLAKGETVRVIDDFSSGRRSNLERLRGRLEVIEASVVDPAAVRRAVEGVDVVFHQAAVPSVVASVENPPGTMLANVQGTTLVLDAARHAKVRRVLFAASCAVYGESPVTPKVETLPPEPLTPYAVSKLAGEALIRVFASLYGMETLSLRYFNIFGPRQDPTSQYAAVIPNFIAAALQNRRPIVYGDGEQTRDFCHVDNVVAANLLAASTSRKLSGEVVNIGCGESTSLNELLRIIAAEVGHPLDADYRAARAGDIRESLSDISAARSLLGYRPEVMVREGLRRTIAALSAAG